MMKWVKIQLGYRLGIDRGLVERTTYEMSPVYTKIKVWESIKVYLIFYVKNYVFFNIATVILQR